MRHQRDFHLLSIVAIFYVLESKCASAKLGWFFRLAVGPETELCGPLKFYCLSSGICTPRAERCVIENLGDNSCPDQTKCYSANWNPSNSAGMDKLESDMENRFFIYRAYSSILKTEILEGAPSGRRRKRRARRNKRNARDALCTLIFDPWKHSFVQYRGFAYEFGKYGVQELDINDPEYKYNREGTSAWEIVGVSGCRRQELWQFVQAWNDYRGEYLWYANNCHHFTNAFVDYLKSDCLEDAYALLSEKVLVE